VRVAPGIDAYGAGGFRIAGVRYEGSVLILEDQPRLWRPSALASLEAEDFEAAILARDTVEFFLLGAGLTVSPPPKIVRERLRVAGVGLEVMSTQEACRLYNVLSSEGRRIAAGLLAVR